MSNLLPIGKFVQLTGLSARMVRFYEKLGILIPDRVDPANQYRYYRYEQTLQAEKIRLLRSLEMPLEEIKQLLNQPDAGQVRQQISQHRQHIEDKIASYRQALAALELLEQNEGTLYPIQERELPAQSYLSKTLEVKLSQVDRIREETLRILSETAHPTGPAFAILGSAERSPNTFEQGLQQAPTTAGFFRYEFGLPIAKAIRTPKGLVFKQLPARRVASALHIGPYEPLHLAFRELNLWCFQQHKPYGQMLEVYHTGPLDSVDPNNYRTEVQYMLEVQ